MRLRGKRKIRVLFDLPTIQRRLKPLNRWRLSLDGKHSSPPRKEELPLRDELFSVDQLHRHARLLAQAHQLKPDGGKRGAERLLPRLGENEAVLHESYGMITEAVARGRRVTPAAEWFLDNYHLIQEQIRIARRDLPRGYSRELPQLNTGPSAGYPRVYVIALELISHVDGRIDADALRAFVTAYQSVSRLRLGELWAIPIMLRLALLENLRRVAVSVASGRRDRERAAVWIERMLAVAVKAPEQVVLVLAEMIKENPPLSTPFITEFATRVQGGGTALTFAITWLEQRVAERGQTVEGIYQLASQSQAADQVSIGNSIGSLRFLGATDWKAFVESMSSVERILHTDPAGVYAAMDFVTRDRYRHSVEDIARQSKRTEDEVAQQAVTLAGSSPKEKTRETHIGYFLIGQGQPILKQWAQMKFSLDRIPRRLARRFPLTAYIGSIAVTSVFITAAVLISAARHGVAHRWLEVWGSLLFLCVTQLAVMLVNWLAMLMVHPRILPRMDFSEGIPSEHKTIAAVPTMLTGSRDVDDLMESLEVRFLSNRDDHLSFALLTDFSDAASERMPEDEVLRQQARHGIEALNIKYPTGGGFFLFHRARRWNAKENVWMGWERKRGKLEDFNEALRGETGRFALVVGPTERLAAVRYVITLDSDTHLPRGAARELVGTMSHTLNRPVFNERLGRVTQGYGILQPRVGISIPSANRSRFAGLFAGEPGLDPYTQAVSDVYQDLFDEGSFIGKGIYDVDAFHKAIGRRLPENRVLSHDLLEGGYVRSGLVSDVVLFEDYPSSYPADMSRRYRWIRGDWQIAAWLLTNVPGVGASRVHNPISALSRWKILDNIRRSLMPVTLLALLLLGWFLPAAAIAFTLVVIGLLLLPAALSGTMELTRPPTDLSFTQHLKAVTGSVGRQILHQLFALACLPYEATVSVNAICSTLTRIVITDRRLLEWRTASDAQRSSTTSIAGFYSFMVSSPLLAVVSALTLCFVHAPSLIAAGPVIVLWLISPSIAYWLSLPIERGQPNLTVADLAFLGNLSRRTWRFFETFVGPADNYLPPDNFQEEPATGIAHRTSPTNIGLYLLANLAAYDFGYTTVADVIERTTQTLDTLDKMQRHRGHFYNWYDTRSLQPLLPLYISTVDSGNLAGHLLTLAAGLEALPSQSILRPVVLTGLGSTLDCLLETLRDRDAGTLKLLRERLARSPIAPSDFLILLQQLAAAAGNVLAVVGAGPDADLTWWGHSLVRQCQASTEELAQLSSTPADVHTLADIARMESGDSETAAKRIAQLKHPRHPLPRAGGHRLRISL